nr:retrovirus-related Pol polyprotein from transposon TNT 1-94 [Tanacetum cinerariifolium]
MNRVLARLFTPVSRNTKKGNIRRSNCSVKRYSYSSGASLKALDEGYSSKNYVRKFLRALHPKWRAKVMAIKESKDLTSLSLDELIQNFKVHEMIIKKDFKIVKTKRERKYIALKGKKKSSDVESLTSGSKDGEYAMAIKDFKKFVKRRGRFVRQPRNDKNTFQRSQDVKNDKSSWSDSGEEDDGKAKDEMCLMAQASSGVHFKLSYFSNENSSIDDTILDYEDKLGLGFNLFEALTSETKETKFVKSQNETSSDGGPQIADGVPHSVPTAPKENQGLSACSSENRKYVSFQKSIMGPRPKHIIVNNVKIPVASDDEICLGIVLDPDEWIKDSGYSKHMIGNRKLFLTYMAYNGENVVFGSNIRGRGVRKSGLYVMKLRKKPKDKNCLTIIIENSTLWHRRLGHANMHLIQSLASKELARNLPKLKFDQHFCDACKIRKQCYVSHKAKNIVSMTRCLKLLHMNLFGPSAMWSYRGNLYTLVIVDDYSWKNLDENGVIYRNKARLVAQGYNQQDGIDYDETYAPVARLDSVRILLAYACALDFKLFQMDIKSAFLNGFINLRDSLNSKN